jgi:hypothetical protein
MKMLIVEKCVLKTKFLLSIIYYFYYNFCEKTKDAAPIEGALVSTKITFLRISRGTKMAGFFAVENGGLLSD